jgi:hypothetical protein
MFSRAEYADHENRSARCLLAGHGSPTGVPSSAKFFRFLMERPGFTLTTAFGEVAAVCPEEGGGLLRMHLYLIFMPSCPQEESARISGTNLEGACVCRAQCDLR